MEESAPTHLGRQEKSMYWDWWRENPTELVLLVLIIAAFALVPWEGCGVTEQDGADRATAEEIRVVP